ncbi:UvrD-helicase domain-containing protein [Methanococcoides seepicolus]|uniref:DNA 3'-5' helicase n=1 Tax=Methanococcoides seepicolus TaxID=2828780 RepID=A0A9E4ZFD2_9EURY|nr:UvrD-helicase domain-containing protein [Methanococcoides seepicolus]MCM1987066.1 ATP-dependent helicase [Methanococcoides seepicolus]
MTRISIWGAPGCGKTTRLIKEFVKQPENTLLTTFRRNTANEIRGRLSESTQIDFDILESNIKTIHGECYTLLGGKGYAKVVNSAALKEFSSEAGYKVKAQNYNNPGRGLMDCHAWLANTGTPLKMVWKYPNFRELKISPSTATDSLKHYGEWKIENGYIDFTDMLTDAYEQGLVPEQNILMDDEFQDQTYLQNKIINTWAEDMDQVIIAGDPLQSLYGFWGGSPDYFEQFQGELEVLPVSHRLTPEIWNFGAEVVRFNGMQPPDIETSHRHGIIKQLNERDYFAHVELWEGVPGNTAFHLVRSNYQAPSIAFTMAENGILWNGLYGWSYTELCVFNAIILVRNGQWLEKEHFRALVDTYPLKYFDFEGTKKELKESINKISTSDCQLYMTFQLYQILKSADSVAHMSNPGKLIVAKINNALVRYRRPLSGKDFHTTLTTIHGSKGLEANKVFLHTEITQTIRKSKRKDSAAEARVFYVGITRARNELYIVKNRGPNNYRLPMVVA